MYLMNDREGNTPIIFITGSEMNAQIKAIKAL